jgi:hypothetical protein
MALRRVDVTDGAAGMLRQLTDQHGPLMFHQSGGCCDGSSPMCYPAGEFRPASPTCTSVTSRSPESRRRSGCGCRRLSLSTGAIPT